MSSSHNPMHKLLNDRKVMENTKRIHDNHLSTYGLKGNATFRGQRDITLEYPHLFPKCEYYGDVKSKDFKCRSFTGKVQKNINTREINYYNNTSPKAKAKFSYDAIYHTDYGYNEYTDKITAIRKSKVYEESQKRNVPITGNHTYGNTYEACVVKRAGHGTRDLDLCSLHDKQHAHVTTDFMWPRRAYSKFIC